MREIKFRAFMVEDNHMETGQGLVKSLIGEHGDGTRYHVMQYTGLKDKNGVEIYEGDILLYLPRKLFIDSEQSRRYGKIYWKEKDACFGLLTFRIDDRETNYDEPFPMAGIEKHEVIGNIHENPELLERL